MRNEKVQIPIVGVIVIEGVFLQRKEWRDFFTIWCIWIVQRDTLSSGEPGNAEEPFKV